MIKRFFQVALVSSMVSFSAFAQTATPPADPPAPHDTPAGESAPAGGAIKQKPLDKKTKSEMKKERNKKKHSKALQKIQDMEKQSADSTEVK